MACKNCGHNWACTCPPLTCPKCDDKALYSETHDSYYCRRCNMWIEDKCRDLQCEFCGDRPEFPVWMP